MKRVLIIGSNGAGKSTFSFILSEKTGLPLIHLDQIYWYDDWQVTPHPLFCKAVQNEAEKDEWIIEGNNIRTLDQRLRYVDTVFWFEFSPAVCIVNIIKRELKYRGKSRPDMPESCKSRLDFSFLRYAWSFNRKNRGRIAKLLGDTEGIDIICFKRRSQVKRFLKTLDSAPVFQKDFD